MSIGLLSPESKQTPPRPAMLDVVRFDKDWCQVVSTPNSPESLVMRLESGEAIHVSWSDWELIRRFGRPVRDINDPQIRAMRNIGSDIPMIPLNVIKKIRWGPEQIDNPRLHGEVTLFGFYRHK